MEHRKLLLELAERLRSQPPVVRLEEGRLIVVGDTHGYPEVTRWALGLADEEQVDHIVFLGDYVDRGPRGVENLELLAEETLSRSNLVLLRGNHESPLMNFHYGFAEEAAAKRGEGYMDAVEEVYKWLPVAAVVEKKLLLIHGGVACSRCSSGPEDPPGLGEIEERASRLRGTDAILEPEDPLLLQVLWNDPRGTIDWFLWSPRGPGIYLYGKKAWTRFLEENGLSAIVRAHEAVDAVHVWLPDGSQLRGLGDGKELGWEKLQGGVVTVFSSLYHGRGAGALLLNCKSDGCSAEVRRYPA